MANKIINYLGTHFTAETSSLVDKRPRRSHPSFLAIPFLPRNILQPCTPPRDHASCHPLAVTSPRNPTPHACNLATAPATVKLSSRSPPPATCHRPAVLVAICPRPQRLRGLTNQDRPPLPRILVACPVQNLKKPFSVVWESRIRSKRWRWSV